MSIWKWYKWISKNLERIRIFEFKKKFDHRQERNYESDYVINF